jgi:hypothetical protein
VSLTNHSGKPLEDLPLKLYINSAEKGNLSISLEANSTKSIELSYVTDDQVDISGKIEIEDHPINFDNTLYFSYRIPKKSQILHVKNASTNFTSGIEKLYRNDSLFHYESLSKVNLSQQDLSKYQLLILDQVEVLSSGQKQQLKIWITNGGRLVLIPTTPQKLSSTNELLKELELGVFTGWDSNKTSLATISQEHQLYTNVFKDKKKSTALPIQYGVYSFSPTNNSHTPLLSLSNGLPFLSEIAYGKGNVNMFYSPISKEYGEFTNHAIFVITFLQFGLQQNSTQQLFSTIGTNTPYSISSLKNTSNSLHIVGNSIDFIPDVRTNGFQSELRVYDQITDAGTYNLLKKDSLLGSLAFNYNKLESSVSIYTESDLNEFIGNNKKLFIHTSNFDSIGQELNELELGKELWHLMLVLSIVMLVFEILLIKFWKI